MSDLRVDQEAPVDPSTLPSPAPESPVEALEWLGGTADEVAENLRLRGIRGERWEPATCPLAVYLREWWPTAHVAMGTSWDDNNMGVDWNNPGATCEFEDAFDDGEYPDLIA